MYGGQRRTPTYCNNNDNNVSHPSNLSNGGRECSELNTKKKHVNLGALGLTSLNYVHVLEINESRITKKVAVAAMIA